MGHYKFLLFLVATILTSQASQAQTIEDDFRLLIDQIGRGISGYEGQVQPLAGETALRYGPSGFLKRRIRTIIRTPISNDREADYIDIDTRYVFSRNKKGPRIFENEFEVLGFETKYEGGPNVRRTEESLIPIGSKIYSTIDETGTIKSVNVKFPPGTDPDSAPKQGTPEHQEMYKKILSIVDVGQLTKSKAQQNDTIFKPVLFPIGDSPESIEKRGDGPSLRGTTRCGKEKCLILEIDETMSFRSGKNEVRGPAKGYILLHSKSLNNVETLIWVHSEIGKGVISDMILTAQSE